MNERDIDTALRISIESGKHRFVVVLNTILGVLSSNGGGQRK